MTTSKSFKLIIKNDLRSNSKKNLVRDVNDRIHGKASKYRAVRLLARTSIIVKNALFIDVQEP